MADGVTQQQGGAALDLDQRRTAGQDVGREFRVCHVRNEHAAQFAADLLAGVEGQPFAIGRELAGPDEGSGKVGAGDRHGLAHRPLG